MKQFYAIIFIFIFLNCGIVLYNPFQQTTFQTKQDQFYMTAPDAISGLVLWLDAKDIYGDGSPAPNGTSVSVWTDKSGNNYDFTPSTGVAAPVIQGSSIGPNAGVYFSGETNTGRDREMLRNDSLDIRQAAINDLTVISVFVWRGDDHSLLTSTQNEYNKRFFILDNYSLDSVNIGQQEFLYDGVANTNYLIWDNGLLVSNSVTSFETSAADIGCAISCFLFAWANFTGVYFSEIVLGEVIIYDHSLSAEDRVGLTNHLAVKWGINL